MRSGWLSRHAVALAAGLVLLLAAASLVWWVPISVRWQVRRLAGGSETERVLAVRALVDLGRDAIPSLTRFADHPDRRVREGVARALAELATDEALQALLPFLADRDEDVRRVAAWALLGEGRMLERYPVAVSLDDADPVLRLCAVRLLSRQGTSAVESLIGALEDEASLVRLAAARQLRAVTGRRFGFDAFADEAHRAAAASRWRAWWRTERRRLPDARMPLDASPLA